MAVQRGQAWLDAASPEEVFSAHRQGALNDLLGLAQLEETSDVSAAAALGLTLAQYAQIESPESLRAITAHLASGKRSSDGMVG